MQMDARRIPFQEEFDAIGAFDVLEHIEEDTTVLRQTWQALRPGGVLLVTVAQHSWLWSASDEYACHVRRYAAHDLERKISAAGFSILRSTSFVSLLLPMMMYSRLKNRKLRDEIDEVIELNLPRLLNSILYQAMLCELWLVRNGVNFPAGGHGLSWRERLDDGGRCPVRAAPPGKLNRGGESG
jgi:SAM-dependent methyltransferase